VNRITELVLGLLVVAACILVMAVTGASDAETDRSYIRHRATIAAEQQWGTR
jgi:hypothetical protein